MIPAVRAREHLEQIVDTGRESHRTLQSPLSEESRARHEALVRLGIEAEVALARIRAVEGGGR